MHEAEDVPTMRSFGSGRGDQARSEPRPPRPSVVLGWLVDVMAAWVLRRRADGIIRQGRLQVRLPFGRVIDLGRPDGLPIRIAIADYAWCIRIALWPGLAVGEAYTEGALTIEDGDLYAFTDLIGRNAALERERRPSLLSRWWCDQRRHANARAAARRNVAHHYDLSTAFYRQFLDEDLQYSCAYFQSDGEVLDAAQTAKKLHLVAKLCVAPGQDVLDIGCGWGGLSLTLAQVSGARVHGVTLSTEQLATARERARQAALSNSVRFSLTDYRDVEGRYDAIVSVGMFEHVGRPNFQTYFAQIARLLNDDGVAVIHSIGRAGGPGVTQPWIAKYIFPGGYIPSLSEMVAAAESAGLIVMDVEVLRLHYAKTIRCWRERFKMHRDRIAALYDNRFCRMWEFYLCVSETAFRRYGHSVFQLQLAKRIDAVPTTRDYLAHAEGRLKSALAGVTNTASATCGPCSP